MAETLKQSAIRQIKEAGEDGITIPLLRESATVRSLVEAGVVRETVSNDGRDATYTLAVKKTQ